MFRSMLHEVARKMRSKNGFYKMFPKEHFVNYVVPIRRIAFQRAPKVFPKEHIVEG